MITVPVGPAPRQVEGCRRRPTLPGGEVGHTEQAVIRQHQIQTSNIKYNHTQLEHIFSLKKLKHQKHSIPERRWSLFADLPLPLQKHASGNVIDVIGLS